MELEPELEPELGQQTHPSIRGIRGLVFIQLLIFIWHGAKSPQDRPPPSDHLGITFILPADLRHSKHRRRQHRQGSRPYIYIFSICAMAPDLNSLPPSSPSARPRIMNSSSSNGDVASSDSPPPRSPRGSISLQAAATMNAGLQHEPIRRKPSTIFVQYQSCTDLYLDPAGSSSGSLSRHRQSPQAGRRRSSVLMNLQLNDPTLPGPGEMVAEERHGLAAHSPQAISGSPRSPFLPPHHNRTPSLGELHQELEAEQEAQVVC